MTPVEREYESPKMVVLGDLRELTRAHTSNPTSADGGTSYLVVNGYQETADGSW